MHRLKHDGCVRSVVFNPDGTNLATASDDGTARIWDAATGTEMHRLKHIGSAGFVVFSPDGTKIATTNGIWDPDTGLELDYNSDTTGWGSAVFSPDGKKLAVESGSAAYIFDLVTENDPKNNALSRNYKIRWSTHNKLLDLKTVAIGITLLDELMARQSDVTNRTPARNSSPWESINSTKADYPKFLNAKNTFIRLLTALIYHTSMLVVLPSGNPYNHP